MAVVIDAGFMASPAGSDDPKLGDDKIRELKLAFKETLEKEHNFDLTEAGNQPRRGLHKAGSAVAFFTDTEPTTRNGAALGSNDGGLLWITTAGQEFVWNGTLWLLKSAYLTEVRLTSGSGNWTVPTGVFRIRVKCIGGGAGGRAGGDSGGGNGPGGVGGLGSTNSPSNGCTGGTGAISAGGCGGSGGGSGGIGGPGGISASGAVGGAGSFGGGGGGGGGTGSGSGAGSGGGGGGGGGTDIGNVSWSYISVTPGQSIAYAVGAGGAAATAGNSTTLTGATTGPGGSVGTIGGGGAGGAAGGAGGSGLIIIQY